MVIIMELLTDKFHNKKLKDFGINIKTKYIVGNKILERNSDNSYNDEIIKGIRCEKLYYKNNILLHNEKTFDSRIEYTYLFGKEKESHKCNNCGYEGKLEEYSSGCPYCRTYYNIDYIDKDLGSKYYYDRVIKSNTYRIITGIIDLIISLFLAYIFIKTTSRTFNNIDIYKIFIYGFILSAVLYYFFYLIDAYIILTPIKLYKDNQNNKQRLFWQKASFDKKTFFNNLNYEIRKKYYNEENIIDYDILDYISYEDYIKDNNLYIKVCADVRIVYYKNNKIYSKVKKEEYILKKYNKEILKLNEGVTLIKCFNCGASIDATKGHCDYCRTDINYIQEWIME